MLVVRSSPRAATALAAVAVIAIGAVGAGTPVATPTSIGHATQAPLTVAHAPITLASSITDLASAAAALATAASELSAVEATYAHAEAVAASQAFSQGVHGLTASVADAGHAISATIGTLTGFVAGAGDETSQAISALFEAQKAAFELVSLVDIAKSATLAVESAMSTVGAFALHAAAEVAQDIASAVSGTAVHVAAALGANSPAQPAAAPQTVRTSHRSLRVNHVAGTGGVSTVTPAPSTRSAAATGTHPHRETPKAKTSAAHHTRHAS